MKIKLFILFLIIGNISIFGQTIIHNGQEVSGKWKISGSPYIIEGEAVVPEGKTLKIQPGVEVQFKTGSDFDFRYSDGSLNPKFNLGFLRVEGQLIAKGKKNKMIVFTNKGKYGKWGNIFFVDSKDNYLSYCHVEYSQHIRYATEDDNATGAISFLNSSGTVENCVISNSWSGINCKQGSAPEIINCVITDNEYGIESNSESKPNVVNTIIWNNVYCFYINAEAKVKISHTLIQDDFLEKGVYDKGNNILGKNPRMNSKFKISTSSPCNKTGLKGENMGVLW